MRALYEKVLEPLHSWNINGLPHLGIQDMNTVTILFTSILRGLQDFELGSLHPWITHNYDLPLKPQTLFCFPLQLPAQFS